MLLIDVITESNRRVVCSQKLSLDPITLEVDAQWNSGEIGKGKHFASNLDHQHDPVKGAILNGSRLSQQVAAQDVETHHNPYFWRHTNCVSQNQHKQQVPNENSLMVRNYN